MSKPKQKGLKNVEAHEKEAKQKENLEKLKKMPTYVVRNAAQVLSANPVPPIEVWGGICLNNDITEIIGASGIGKSRIILDLAVRQCLADTKFDDEGKSIPSEFAGLPLYRGPIKWLLVGSENGLYRYHSDLKKMTSSCSKEQIKKLGERLFMMTLEGEGDTYIALDGQGDPEEGSNFMKLKALVARVDPDVIVFDPWGDLIGGSELDDRVVRDTIALLRRLKNGIRNNMAIIIVNHARMGLAENTKAIGLDAANFGKNSKVLFTIARCVWNLTYLKNDPTSKEIGFSNAKRSNGEPYKPRGVWFNKDKMTYDYKESIDVEQSLHDMEAEASKPTQNKDATRAEEYDRNIKKGVGISKDAVSKAKDRVCSRDSLIRKMQKEAVPERIRKDVLACLVEDEGYERFTNPADCGRAYFGLKEDVEAYMAKYDKKKPDKRDK